MFTIDISVNYTRPENTMPNDGHPGARANCEFSRRLGDFLQEKAFPAIKSERDF
jgi:hypothetical protein